MQIRKVARSPVAYPPDPHRRKRLTMETVVAVIVVAGIAFVVVKKGKK